MGVSGRPIRACAEPMPNTIPSSAAPNSTIRPASIINRNILRIAVILLCRNPLQPLAQSIVHEFFRQSRDRPPTNEQISATQMGRNFTDASRELSLSGVYCSKGKHRVGGDSNGAIRRAREHLYARERTLTPVTRSELT